MRVEASKRANAPPEDVWRWWTDYGAQGTEHEVDHGWAKSRRRVLEREGDRLVLEEKLSLPLIPGGPPVLRHEVTLHEAERRIHERARGPLGYESDYYFEPEDEGRATRVRRVLEVRTPGPTAKLARYAEPVTRKLTERDLASHVKEFERQRGRRS